MTNQERDLVVSNRKDGMADEKKQRRPIWLLAGFLAWLIPGAGHVYIGRVRRGIILFVTIAAMFWAGVAMGGVMTVDARYETWWCCGQLLAGIHGLVGWFRQERIYKELEADPDVAKALKARRQGAAEENEQRKTRGYAPSPLPPMTVGTYGGRPDDVQMEVTKKLAERRIALDEPVSGVAYAFSGVAGMLNLMVIFDALILALLGKGKEPTPSRTRGREKSAGKEREA
jgi:hypothetical protein